MVRSEGEEIMSFPWDVMTEANDQARIHAHERALHACMSARRGFFLSVMHAWLLSVTRTYG